MNRLYVKYLLIICLAAGSGAALLTLADAERRAASNGFDVMIKRSEEISQKWEARNAMTNYLPSVTYGATYLRMDGKTVRDANESYDMIMQGLFSSFAPGTQTPDNPNKLYEYSLSHEICVTQAITNGGAEIIAIGIAGELKTAAALQAEAARLEAIYNTRKSYFDVIIATEQTLIAEQALAFAQQNLAKAKTRNASGAVPQTDVLQWEAEVSQKESDFLMAKAGRSCAVTVLLGAMGMGTENADTSLLLQPITIFEAQCKKERIIADGSLEKNQLVRSVCAYTRATKGFKRMAASRDFPRLNAFYKYAWPAWDRIEPRTERKGWTAGVALNVPLFSGFRTTTSCRKADEEYRKAEIVEAQVKSQLALNLNRIVLFYEAAYQAVGATEKQKELMEKQLSIMQERYDGGLVNQTQLLEVALGANCAKMNHVRKLFECLLLAAEYDKTMGILEVSL